MSYGGEEIGLNASYGHRFNQELQKAGLRGISVLVAAGDDGVGCNQQFAKGKPEAFSPDFPASFPAITTVGGTDFTSGSGSAETTWSSGGGGFSQLFPRPSYQDAAVEAFLKDNKGSLPPSSFFHAQGRACAWQLLLLLLLLLRSDSRPPARCLV